MVAHINTKVIAAQADGQPVISVDTKKKELVLRTTRTRHSLKVRRKKAGWSTRYLDDVLNGVG